MHHPKRNMPGARISGHHNNFIAEKYSPGTDEETDILGEKSVTDRNAPRDRRIGKESACIPFAAMPDGVRTHQARTTNPHNQLLPNKATDGGNHGSDDYGNRVTNSVRTKRTDPTHTPEPAHNRLALAQRTPGLPLGYTPAHSPQQVAERPARSERSEPEPSKPPARAHRVLPSQGLQRIRSPWPE